jgi:hypothetical protein
MLPKITKTMEFDIDTAGCQASSPKINSMIRLPTRGKNLSPLPTFTRKKWMGEKSL